MESVLCHPLPTTSDGEYRTCVATVRLARACLMIPKSGPPFTGNAISAQSHGLVALF
jgi:hypothetical protein